MVKTLGCWGSKFRDNPKMMIVDSYYWIVRLFNLWGFCGCGVGCDDHEEKEEKKRTMTVNHKTNMKTKNSIIRMMTMKQVFHSSWDLIQKTHQNSSWIQLHQWYSWMIGMYLWLPPTQADFPAGCWVPLAAELWSQSMEVLGPRSSSQQIPTKRYLSL